MEVTATESLAFADAHSSKNITRTTVPETQEESQADLIQRLREEKLKSATKVEEVSTKLSALQAAISAHKDDISQYCPVAWLEMQPLLTQGTELDLLGFCEEFNYEENQARVNGDDIFENGELINPENFTKALSAHEEYDESSVGILQTPEPSMVDYPERSSSGATQMHNRSLPGASKSVQKTRRAKNGRVFPCNIGRCGKSTSSCLYSTGFPSLV